MATGRQPELWRRKADLCAALGNPKRLMIVSLLAEGPRSVGKLVKGLRTKQPTVSHHLLILRLHGIVTSQRKGRQIIYSLSAATADTVLALLKA